MPPASKWKNSISSRRDRLVTFCVVSVVLGTFAGASGEDRAFSIVTKIDRGFPSSERVSRESNEAINAAISVLSEQFEHVSSGRDLHRPARVVVHRKASAYRRSVRRIGASRFEENLAVTDYGRSESHVAVQPGSSRLVLEQSGLSLLTKRQIAHEAAHLWCDARWPQAYQSAPRWLREGLATWASESAMRKLGWIGRAEDDPFLSTRLMLVQHVTHRLVELRSPSASNDPFASFDRRTTYALDWAWCRWQLSRRGRLGTGAEAATRGMSIDQLIAWFERDASNAMQRFCTVMRSTRPVWGEAARSLEIHGDIWMQLAFSETEAMAWRLAGPSQPAYRIKGSLQRLGNANAEARVLFAREASGYLVASFGSQTGVAISRFDERSGSLTELARNKDCRVRVGSPSEFEVIVRKGRVSIEVEGNPVCRAEVPDIWLSGPWGLSVEANQAAVWRHVGIAEVTE